MPLVLFISFGNHQLPDLLTFVNKQVKVTTGKDVRKILFRKAQ